MSDTPRTDAGACHVSVDRAGCILLWHSETGEYVERKVSAQLERENAELHAENAALRADAERYRWIKRDNIGVHDVLELFMSYINCDLDKEIDQTRAKEAKP